jgi:predicted Zn-dependent peptidase
VYAGTHPDNVDETLDTLTSELVRLRTVPPTAAEFHRAKQQLRSSLVMNTESLSARMHTLARMVLEERSLEPIESSIESIQHVTLEQVQTLAHQLSNPSDWSVVICR